MTPSPAFVLVHSPRVGPLTWALVARELARRKFPAITPVLPAVAKGQGPYAPQHVAAIAAAVEASRPEAVVLVGHSGAGPLLPAVSERLSAEVAAYVLVDAHLPRDGASRLELFESIEAAEEFEAEARDGLLPVWSDDDLRDVIPDPRLRARFVAELRPLPLAVYREALRVFVGWPDAPCAYLRFSAVYCCSAQEALAAGWPCVELLGGHFHMLVEPRSVTDALVDVTRRILHPAEA